MYGGAVSCAFYQRLCLHAASSTLHGVVANVYNPVFHYTDLPERYSGEKREIARTEKKRQ